jgi:hypothetical protein
MIEAGEIGEDNMVVREERLFVELGRPDEAWS